MKMRRTKSIIGFIVIGILYFAGAHIYVTKRNERIKGLPKHYVYENYRGVPNPVLFISNLKYKNEYLNYYTKVKAGGNPSFGFPLKGMPQNDPVYIIDYTSDSTLVKIVSYYNRGKHFGGSYTEGYVFIEALHDSLPNEK